MAVIERLSEEEILESGSERSVHGFSGDGECFVVVAVCLRVDGDGLSVGSAFDLDAFADEAAARAFAASRIVLACDSGSASKEAYVIERRCRREHRQLA